MPLSLHDRLLTMGDDNFHTYAFRNTLENHLNILKNSNDVTVINIDRNDLLRYNYDLYGLLKKYNVDPQLWWITMRVNGMVDPRSYGGMKETLIIPNREELDLLLSRTLTKDK